jgi:hypothetical protein
MGGIRTVDKFFVGEPVGRRPLEKLDMDSSIILE